MRQRTYLAIIAALLGTAALWWLFVPYDRSAHLGQFRISRQGAIRKARRQLPFIRRSDPRSGAKSWSL